MAALPKPPNKGTNQIWVRGEPEKVDFVDPERSLSWLSHRSLKEWTSAHTLLSIWLRDCTPVQSNSIWRGQKEPDTANRDKTGTLEMLIHKADKVPLWFMLNKIIKVPLMCHFFIWCVHHLNYTSTRSTLGLMHFHLFDSDVIVYVQKQYLSTDPIND